MSEPNELVLQVTISDDGATMSVRVCGEVDASNAELICAVVTEASGQEEIRRAVVDLEGVDFMDSSGVSALLECWNHLRAVGVHLDVIGARGDPLRVLEMTGVLSFFHSHADDESSQASPAKLRKYL